MAVGYVWPSAHVVAQGTSRKRLAPMGRDGKAALPSLAPQGLGCRLPGCPGRAHRLLAHTPHSRDTVKTVWRRHAAVVKKRPFPGLPSRHLGIVRRDDPGGRHGGA